MATVPVEETPGAPARPASGPALRRLQRRLRHPSPRLTLVLALGGLSAIAVVSYGWYAAHGGLFDDDWYMTAIFTHRPDGGGVWAGLRDLWQQVPWRPMFIPYNALVLGGLGWHTTLQFTWSVGLSVAFVGLLFQVMRTCGVPAAHAFAVAALVLVSPFGDSVVLWISGATIRFAGVLYLLGLHVAIGALRAETTGRARLLHTLATVLYVLAVWSVEQTATLVVAGLLVYLAVAPRRRALRRWAVDLVAVGLALIWTLTHTLRGTQHSVGGYWHHGKVIVGNVWTMFDGVAAPGWFPAHVAPMLALLAAAVGIAHLVLRRRGRIGGPVSDAVRRWTLVLGVAFAYVLAAYAEYVPSDDGYIPNDKGTPNRVDGLAIAPLVLVAYASAMILLTTACLLRPRWLRAATAVALVYAAGMFTVYHARLRHDEHAWVRAYGVAHHALTTLQRLVPHPAAGTYFVVLHVPHVLPPKNPIFLSDRDFSAAVRKLYGDGTLTAYSALFGGACGPDGLAVTEGPTGVYGRSLFIDVRHQRAYGIPDFGDCRRVVERLAAG
jgi:hypothetical protein